MKYHEKDLESVRKPLPPSTPGPALHPTPIAAELAAWRGGTHAEIVMAKRELEATRAELELSETRVLFLVAILQYVEWRGFTNMDDSGFDEACPYCEGAKKTGHTKACPLGTVLRHRGDSPASALHAAESPKQPAPAPALAPLPHEFPGIVEGVFYNTSDCIHGCGAWMGGSRSGGPDGVDPFGPCPKRVALHAAERGEGKP